jgi:hypothetical protein
MTKRKTTNASAAALTYAEALAIPSASRIPRFQLEASAGQRAFSAMAKLFRVIEKSLPSGETIFPMLMRAGIKKGTVSNASIAASVFDLVEAGTMTEAEFDALSFNDCWQTKRVLSAKSRKQLTPVEAVAMIRKSPDFAEEFATLFEHGLTAKEFSAKETKTSTAASKPPQQKADPGKNKPDHPTSGQLIQMLEQIELAMASLPADDQGVVGAKLVEMASAFVESGKSVASERRKMAA